MFAIKIKKNKAQEIINRLKEDKNLDNKYKIKHTKTEVIIPVLKITKELANYKTSELLEKQNIKNKKYKELLLEKGLDKNIVSKLNTAYDIVGDIIIIGIEKEHKKHYKDIGETLIKLHKNIKTVLNKIGEHKGIYRTQDMEFVYGVNTKETKIKENGCVLKTDVEKVFFSTRLSEERKRIVNLVKPDETIGVFFAGVGPFALAIAKNKRIKEIVAIELNEIAVKYLLENIELNKLTNKIKPILGDVKIEAQNYPNYFDRIVMPLPNTADLFLESAIFSVKNNGVIHVYKFVPKTDPYTEIEDKIMKLANENKVKLKIINKRIIKSYSPAIVQIVIDLKVSLSNRK